MKRSTLWILIAIAVVAIGVIFLRQSGGGLLDQLASLHGPARH